MIDLEDRLRRTFDAVAATELPSPDVPLVMPMRRRWPVPAAAAAAVLLVAAGAAVVAERPAPERRALSGAGRGLADYEVSEAEQHLLVRANRRLVAACMAAAGQPYVDGWPGDVGRLDAHWNALGRTDLQRAEELGYAIPRDSHGSIPRGADPMTDAWRRALVGDGATDEVTDPVTGKPIGTITTGGCQGEADRAMYGDVVRWQGLSRFTFQQRGQVDEAVLADPRVVAGIDAWAGCMADRGRDYPRPTTPPAGFDALPSTPPSDEEVATAVDDVECKRSSGLIAVYEAVELELGRTVVAEHPDLLAEHRAIVERALDRAEEILADDEAEPTRRPPVPRFEGTPERLDAEVRVEPRKEGLVTLVITVHSVPSRPATWLLVLVDGKVISSSTPLTVTTLVPVPVGDGSTKVRVVATDASGLVVADHGLRSLSGD